MCGIIGYVGNKEATPILINGLKKLEYRGYDSSGVGVICPDTGEIMVRKTQGKIQNLQDLIAANHLPPKATIGISHTRWATHGAPNRINAHPHFDHAKNILVVHNGIIENYQELKVTLQAKGYAFVSETDTEVIAHLIAYHYRGDLFNAVKEAIAEMRGAFAIGVICKNCPDLLIAAKQGSPLIIGVGKGENFIAETIGKPRSQNKNSFTIFHVHYQTLFCVLTEQITRSFTHCGYKTNVSL